jgi:hypothetical protein
MSAVEISGRLMRVVVRPAVALGERTTHTLLSQRSSDLASPKSLSSRAVGDAWCWITQRASPCACM